MLHFGHVDISIEISMKGRQRSHVFNLNNQNASCIS